MCGRHQPENGVDSPAELELLRRLGPTCDACGATLEKVYPDTPPEVLQYDNALHVRFDGGYGEFVDNYGTEAERDRYYAIVCHRCAHELCALVPWIGQMLQPNQSHTHRRGGGR